MSRQEKRSCRNMPWVSADMLLEQSELYRSKMSSGSAFFSLQSQSETLGCRNAMVKQKHRWTWGFITETFQTFLVICTWQAMEEKWFDVIWYEVQKFTKYIKTTMLPFWFCIKSAHYTFTSFQKSKCPYSICFSFRRYLFFLAKQQFREPKEFLFFQQNFGHIQWTRNTISPKTIPTKAWLAQIIQFSQLPNISGVSLLHGATALSPRASGAGRRIAGGAVAAGGSVGRGGFGRELASLALCWKGMGPEISSDFAQTRRHVTEMGIQSWVIWSCDDVW